MWGVAFIACVVSLYSHKKTVVCGNMQAARKLPTILHREKEKMNN
jgi:hypothetical protein